MLFVLLIACGSPEAPPPDPYNGVVEYPGGLELRVEPVECPDRNPPRPCQWTDASSYTPSCLTDDECTSKSGVGYCTGYTIYGEEDCYCTYRCSADTDCSEGDVCVCGGTVEGSNSLDRCVEASCVTNDDCDSRQCKVAAWDGGDGCWPELGVHCVSGADDCLTNADCDGTEECLYRDDRWQCGSVSAHCEW